MSKETFHKLFVHEIKDIFSAENQIVQVLPRLITAATDNSLKEAFTNHLKETKNQIKRLQRILAKLKQSPPKTKCEGMKGILEEGKKAITAKYGENADMVKDAALIGAAQRVEHYEMAAYGTVRAYAKLLNLDEIAELLDETLEEESNANETLNKLAEGGYFSSGINSKATREATREAKRPSHKTVTRRLPKKTRKPSSIRKKLHAKR